MWPNTKTMSPLTKEQLFSLRCLKEVGITGVGVKKIMLIANTIIDNNLTIKTIEDLAHLMSSMKEKAIHSVKLQDLELASQYANRIIKASNDAHIGLVSYFDSDYPEMFRNTINEEGKIDPPLLLWFRGDLSITKMTSLAIIGTREATPEGISGGEYVAAEFAKRGINIVSGLAVGCDTCGHKGALKVGGKTTAILANGLDHNSIYPPENQELAEEIVNNGGVLLSEYSIGTSVNKYNLVARDRLQAGLANATLVVQTGINGGTMHAAMATYKAKKPLFVMLFKDEKTNKHEKCRGNAILVDQYNAKYIKGQDNFDTLSETIKNSVFSPTSLF